MRITNKIMQNNALYNINLNKELEDKLTTQMTKQSKITRPSDDPVVAIRALRLRSNVTTVTQYNEKNAEDADSWISLTDNALDSLEGVLTNLLSLTTSASTKYLTSSDLETYLTQIKELTDEFYADANVDYAGRYIFSGYRTDTTVTFTKNDITDMNKTSDDSQTYIITEDLGFDDISSINFTDWTDAEDELGVTNNTLFRVRLSYNNLDAMDSGEFSFSVDGTDIAVTEYDSAEEAYKAVNNGDCDVAFIPSTGELVFSEDYYVSNFSADSQISVTYEKTNWEEGDANPVHYFTCTGYTGKAAMEEAQAALDELTESGASEDEIADAEALLAEKQSACTSSMIYYNADGLEQNIYYDVGYNQQIQVNTQACDVFDLNLKRDYDDMYSYLTQLQDLESAISDIETKMAGVEEDSDEYKEYSLQYDAYQKAYTYVRENIQKAMENQITKYQSYQDEVSVAATQNGTRGSRLELIKSRLTEQQSTFETLKSANEDADLTELTVQLTSAQLTYDASLAATAKILQASLINYI